MYPIFKNKSEAGKKLSLRLESLRGRTDVIVISSPGSRLVAQEIAREFNVPIEIFVMRGLKVPGKASMEFGAIASGNVCLVNETIVEAFRIPESVIDKSLSVELLEFDRIVDDYGADKTVDHVYGKTVVIVDDGVTSSTALRAGIESVRLHGPREVVLAIPLIEESSCKVFELIQDVRCVFLNTYQPSAKLCSIYQDSGEKSERETSTITNVSVTLHSPSRGHVKTAA